jgi:hypothetical protein
MPWRVFPWDPVAKAGEPFSPQYVFPNQGSGRFDLPGKAVLYLAEIAVHAVAEKLQRFRGQKIDRHDLKESGRPLALVECLVAPHEIADLCDPKILLKLGIAPDAVASRHVGTTQPIAKILYEEGYKGLRWWSALSGDWHSVVLFVDRVGHLQYEKPEQLTLDHQAVKDACIALGVRI